MKGNRWPRNRNPNPTILKRVIWTIADANVIDRKMADDGADLERREVLQRRIHGIRPVAEMIATIAKRERLEAGKAQNHASWKPMHLVRSL